MDEHDRLLYQQAQLAANPIAATPHNDLNSLSFGRYILVTWDGFVQNGSLLQVGFFEIMSRISTIYTLLPEDGLTPYLPNIDENRLKFSQGTYYIAERDLKKQRPNGLFWSQNLKKKLVKCMAQFRRKFINSKSNFFYYF